MMPASFNGRLGLVQRVLPAYRAAFFDALAERCSGGMSLFSGLPRADESIATADKLQRALFSPAKNIHILSPSSPFYICYQRGLTHWLADWNPDGLIVEANFRYLSSRAAIRWMHARKRPVVGWGLGAPRFPVPQEHRDDIPKFGHYVQQVHLDDIRDSGRCTKQIERGPLSWVHRDLLSKSFLSQFDALIAYSQRGAEQYAASGIPVDKIFVAQNAVAPAPTGPLPARTGVFSAQPVLLFVGRLQARKRIPALLKACAGLPAQLKPRLVIVGAGPEAGNLRALAHGLYPAAEFVGAKYGDELDPYFLAADLFVLPGTGGLAVQQAMSFGLPVIVAQGDGTQDDLIRPTNGWQIPPDDDAALASSLREALSDVGRLRAMGAESFRIVAQEINLEKMVSGFVAALNSVKK